MRYLFLALVLGLALCGLTQDKNTHHGHSKEYFDSASDKLRNEQLQVHIVAHTHDDVGWLKTQDEYFSGIHDGIQNVQVETILDNVIDVLLYDETKVFTYVEMAFFEKWWRVQDAEMKKNVKKLVKQNQLSFVLAGWSMADEASPYYEDFINNILVGNMFLEKEVGFKPTIGWQIDPFGHQSATAAIFADMKFDAWFFSRMDYQDKQKRLEEKSLEFLWRPLSANRGNSTEIFTHMTYNHYSAPPGFCFYIDCHDDAIVTDPLLETYNIEEKVDELHDFLIHQAEHYRGNNLFVTWGDDFNFQNAHWMFKNIDRLMERHNEKYPDMNLFYSSPNMYVDAIKKEDITWPVKYDDLYPYADHEHD